MMRTGISNLPLHPGKAPRWLFSRMVKLGGLICEYIIDEFGTAELLKRISNPFFFQALGCVIGFDWHSSGLTTTTCGAIKQYFLDRNIGLYVAGGKGKSSAKTPFEIENSNLSTRNIERLVCASKMIAKVDNSVVQDGYYLYHHCIFFDEHGDYAVVQQGLMNKNGYARRYHWLSSNTNIDNFVDQPHSGIAGRRHDTVLDMTSKHNYEVREACVDLVNDNPIHLYKYFSGQRSLIEFMNCDVLTLKPDHYIHGIDLSARDKQILNRVYEMQPQSYEELIAFKGMGPKKIRALAFAADLIYGTKITWKDPVKYSFAHGGKDGIPFPVQKSDYDNTITFLESALEFSGMEKQKRVFALNRVRRMVFDVQDQD